MKQTKLALHSYRNHSHVLQLNRTILYRRTLFAYTYRRANAMLSISFHSSPFIRSVCTQSMCSIEWIEKKFRFTAFIDMWKQVEHIFQMRKKTATAAYYEYIDCGKVTTPIQYLRVDVVCSEWFLFCLFYSISKLWLFLSCLRPMTITMRSMKMLSDSHAVPATAFISYFFFRISNSFLMSFGMKIAFVYFRLN